MNAPNRKYIVRMPNSAQFIQDDIIIEYSNPNLHLMKMATLTTSPGMEFLIKKMIYIAPVNSMLYLPWNYTKSNRNINTLTTFYNSHSKRRSRVLKQFEQFEYSHGNANGITSRGSGHNHSHNHSHNNVYNNVN